MVGEFHLHKIAEEAKKKGISIRKLSLMAKLSDNTVRTMIERNRGNIQSILAVANVLGMELGELYTGTEIEQYQNNNMEGLKNSLNTIKNVMTQIKSSGILKDQNIEGWTPLITFDMIEPGKRLKDLLDNTPDDAKSYYLPMISGASFCVYMTGKAMEPDLHPGDILICQYIEQPKYLEFGRVYFVETSQGYMVRRLMLGRTEGSLLLTSPNEFFENIEIKKSEITSYSLVLGKLRLE